MKLTAPQLAVVHHPSDAHAVVRAAPGAGKTTTLVARVEHLVRSGVDPERIRVVMYNRSVKETFDARLERAGILGVRVTTFDAFGLEVLRAAERRGLLSKPLSVEVDGLETWARQVHPKYRDDIETADEIAGAVTFWKSHLVLPARAAFPSCKAFVEAFREIEAIRTSGDRLRIAFSDMVYTAVGVLRRHGALLPPPDHLLVDEFQDVNPARVELLKLSMSEGTSLMAVGDEDQAINEWGGANPKFFREVASSFPNRPTVEHRLPHSFRFGPVIAGAATRVIQHDTQRAPGDIVGAGATPGEIRRATSATEAVREALSTHSPRDVAVLYRGRPEGVGAIASLAAAGIPMHTEDSHLLSQGKGPALALAYLAAAHDDRKIDADTAWTVVLGPDRFVRKEPFLEHFRSNAGAGLRAILRDSRGAEQRGQNPVSARKLRDVARILDRMRSARDAGSALDVLADEIDVEETLRQRVIGERHQEIAIASFRAVHDLLRGLRKPLGEAVRAVRELDVTFGAPEASRVRVGTIHKAKGLEWRAVVLIGVSEGTCPALQRGSVPGTVDEPDGIVQSDWIEQERRIFYVGLTRALETVWIDAPPPSSRFLVEAGLVAPPPPKPSKSQKRAASGSAWTAADDADLARLWAQRVPVTELAKRFERTSTAIAARLVKLGLVSSRQEARRESGSARPRRRGTTRIDRRLTDGRDPSRHIRAPLRRGGCTC